MHLLGDVGRRVVDDDRVGRRRLAAHRAGRRSATRPSSPARKSLSNVRFTKPGPATSSLLATPSSACGVDDALGDLARVGADLLRQRQRPVDLGVGAIRRPHDRVDIATPSDLGEDRLQQLGDDGQGVGHRSTMLSRTPRSSACSRHSDQLEMERLESGEGVEAELAQGLSAAGVLDTRPHQRRVDVVAAVHVGGAGRDLVADRDRGVDVTRSRCSPSARSRCRSSIGSPRRRRRPS